MNEVLDTTDDSFHEAWKAKIAVEKERDALRARCEELEESERQSARYHKRVCVVIEQERDALRAQVADLHTTNDTLGRHAMQQESIARELHTQVEQVTRERDEARAHAAEGRTIAGGLVLEKQVIHRVLTERIDQLKSALREALNNWETLECVYRRPPLDAARIAELRRMAE